MRTYRGVQKEVWWLGGIAWWLCAIANPFLFFTDRTFTTFLLFIVELTLSTAALAAELPQEDMRALTLRAQGIFLATRQIVRNVVNLVVAATMQWLVVTALAVGVGSPSLASSAWTLFFALFSLSAVLIPLLLWRLGQSIYFSI